MLCRYVSSTHDPMSRTFYPVVTNLLQEIDDGMESRTTPIQKGEDDEDITMLDTFMPWSSPSYKSSPTQLLCSSRIQPTSLHGFGDISLIGVQMRWSWMRWIDEDEMLLLVLVLALEASWIILCDHGNVPRHLFWAFSGFLSCRALSPCCGRPPGRPQP